MKASAVRLLPEAERLASWAFKKLLSATNSTPYPLTRASASWKQGGNWTLNVRPPRRVRTPRPRAPLTDSEVFRKTLALEKTPERAAKQADEIFAHAGPANVNSGGLHLLLQKSVLRAQAQLVRLADMGNKHGVEALAVSTFSGTNELLELSRRNLTLVQTVARTYPFWPVNYSPHKDAIRELEALIERLGVAKASPERMRGKWSNTPATKQAHRHVVGRYVNRMGFMLRQIREDGNLCQVLHHNPHGWSALIVQLVQLPQLTKASAPDWFACGFEALTEAAGGSVANIAELKPVGDADAAYRRRRRDSVRVQEQVRVRRIRQKLHDAFVDRWGN